MHLISRFVNSSRSWSRKLLVLVYLLATANAARGEESSETDAWSQWQENLRFTIDGSSRVVFRSGDAETFYQNFLGFDLHKVFSGNSGDIGTLTLQGYLTRIDNMNPHPPIFDDEDDWRLIYRIFNYNFRGLGLNGPHIRIGHFEIPYGLEQDINTNGTLRQYGVERNLGLKADWGASVNGRFRTMDYEFSWTQANGQDLTWRGFDDRYTLAGRVGSDQWIEGIDLGLSGYYAELDGQGNRRFRTGADLRWYYQLFGVFTELSVGETNQQSTLNSVVELNWRNPTEQFLLYTQFFYYSQDSSSGWSEYLQTTLGMRYAPDTHWAMSAQLGREVMGFSTTGRKTEFTLQARYRF